MEKFNIPVFFAALQAFLVGTYSLFFALLFEEINLSTYSFRKLFYNLCGFLLGGLRLHYKCLLKKI